MQMNVWGVAKSMRGMGKLQVAGMEKKLYHGDHLENSWGKDIREKQACWTHYENKADTVLMTIECNSWFNTYSVKETMTFSKLSSKKVSDVNKSIISLLDLPAVSASVICNKYREHFLIC